MVYKTVATPTYFELDHIGEKYIYIFGFNTVKLFPIIKAKK